MRVYRSTPHGSSKVAPSNLLLIRSNHSKLPLPVESHSSNESQEKARENDMARKAAMKAYADKRRRANLNQFQIGDKVVLDQHAGRSIFNKYELRFADKLLSVKRIKGSMVTTQDMNGKFMTRNCSLFKKAPPGINDDGELKVLPRGSTSVHGEAEENQQAVVQEQ